jgi:hypothetical protein
MHKKKFGGWGGVVPEIALFRPKVERWPMLLGLGPMVGPQSFVSR